MKKTTKLNWKKKKNFNLKKVAKKHELELERIRNEEAQTYEQKRLEIEKEKEKLRASMELEKLKLEEIDRLTKEKEERDRLSEKERKKNDKKKLEELERAKQEEITKNLQLEKERLQAQLSEKAVASTKKDEYIKTHPDIHSWLNELGLAEYLAVFITNGYDTMEMFSILNDDDLETCQITLTGHRKKILHASNLLSAELNKKKYTQINCSSSCSKENI